MGLKSLLGKLRGTGAADEANRPVSHVCETCGEKYFTDPGADIRECRTCGGLRVEPA